MIINFSKTNPQHISIDDKCNICKLPYGLHHGINCLKKERNITSTNIFKLLKEKERTISQYKDTIKDAFNLFNKDAIPSPDNTKKVKEKEYYKYIQNTEDIHTMINNNIIPIFIKEGKAPLTESFLDVGCGLGNILTLVSNFCGMRTYGIEYDKTLLKPIKDKYFLDRIFIQDALTFKDYNKYSIIYRYCPITDKKLMKKLDRKIIKEASPGTFFIPDMNLTAYIEDKTLSLISLKYTNAQCKIYRKP